MCPLCNIEEESVPHMLSCQSQSATNAREVAATTFEETMHEVGTHPDLVTLLLLVIEDKIPYNADVVVK